MNQSEKREYLIRSLLRERPEYRDAGVPRDEREQKDLLRALMNVRPPAPLPEEYLRIEGEYLRQATAEKGITRLEDLTPAEGDLYLWQGDITTLACDAIVNAANSGMTGCYRPCHNCIDNCIHTYAGLALRNYCDQLMRRQGSEEPTGRAKVTPAFNLPSGCVIHTVGPIVAGPLLPRHRQQLASCYRSCLSAAEENGCGSIAFCCISTGVFGFPQREAAVIAVRTVKEYKAERRSGIRVVFNVFRDDDLRIYRELLG